MIKLVYSPFFGPRPYIDMAERGGVLFGVAPVGTPGLLDALELYMGQKGVDADPLERLVNYVKAMRQAIADDPSLFFADSFRGDEIGTAKVILAWRDTLMMALWTPDTEYDGLTDKLYGLACIEKHFHTPGYADRWRRLLSIFSLETLSLTNDICIECRTSMDVLEPCVRKVLEILEKKGKLVPHVAVSSGEACEGTALRTVQDALLKGSEKDGSSKIALPDDGSFNTISFGFGYDANRWAALSTPKWKSDGTLLVCSDSSGINGSLRVLGYPTFRSDNDSAPQSAQLFLLGLSLFRSPVDVSRLLSYLRVSPNPVGKLYLKKVNKGGEEYLKPLNRELADLLLTNGGFKDWRKTIEGAVFDENGDEYSSAKRREILGRFLMWERVEDGELVPKESLDAWLKNVRRWADGLNQVIEDDPGYRELSSNCKAMEMLLDGAPDKIGSEQISRWAEGIFSVIKMTTDISESGSGESVPDIRDMMDSPRNVVWLGACGTGAADYPYPFLSHNECQLLGVPSRDDYSSSVHRSLIESIARIKKSLTLVYYSSDNGTVLQEHPVITELSSIFRLQVISGTELVANHPETDSFPVTGLTKSKVEYHVNPELFTGIDKTYSNGGILPDRESYSSLEKLIHYPFDYVLLYLLRFEPYGEGQLSDISKVKGNVAHLYLHELVEKNKSVGLDAIEDSHAANFDSGVFDAAEKDGAILLSQEKGLEWGKFKNLLKTSVDNLLTLIRRNNYRIIGSEVEILTDLPVIGPFKAYVDLLLKDQYGRYVIFDFKWNEASTYNKKMEQRDIMQLILYKEAVQRFFNNDVSVYGYWILPKCTFLTECQGVIGDNVIPYRTQPDEMASMRDIFVQIQNSYRFRMEQIRRGLIEEGEKLLLADIEYYRKQAEKNLYPLKGDYDAPTLKGRPYGNDNITLKGGLV